MTTSLMPPAMSAPSPAPSDGDSLLDHGHAGHPMPPPGISPSATHLSTPGPVAINGAGTPNKRSYDEIKTNDDSDSDGGALGGRDKRAGRRKIKIEYIEDKSRRHITFSKRKAGIMKKAYELSTLTGTQVLLLVVSETGLVYTFTTPKLQPIVTKPEGKNLIQACLNAPDPLPDTMPGSDNSAAGSPAPMRGGSGGGSMPPAPPSYGGDHSAAAVNDSQHDITAAAAAAAAAAGLYGSASMGADPHRVHAPPPPPPPPTSTIGGPHAGYPLGLASLGYAPQPHTVGYSNGSPMSAIAQQYGAVASPYSPVGPYAPHNQPGAHYGSPSMAGASTAANIYTPYWNGSPQGASLYTTGQPPPPPLSQQQQPPPPQHQLGMSPVP